MKRAKWDAYVQAGGRQGWWLPGGRVEKEEEVVSSSTGGHDADMSAVITSAVECSAGFA